MSVSVTDWAAWHDAYRDPASALTRRLEVVRDQIRSALPAGPRKPFHRPPDLTPQISGWFAEAGFAELAFTAPEDELFSVGACRFLGELQPLGSARLFTFIR